jgi:hypothetical protein
LSTLILAAPYAGRTPGLPAQSGFCFGNLPGLNSLAFLFQSRIFYPNRSIKGLNLKKH